jgi:hypothetical protein
MRYGKESDVHRHRFDTISLGFGLLFAVLGLAFLTVPPVLVGTLPWRWLVWGGVIAMGLALLVDAVRRMDRPSGRADDADPKPALDAPAGDGDLPPGAPATDRGPGEPAPNAAAGVDDGPVGGAQADDEPRSSR